MSNLCSPLLARISVVMCTYRGTAHLQVQLDSLLAQADQIAELIVCDDNSMDGTVKLLELFREQAPFRTRIVVNATNLGSTLNFDQALQLATGEYLALCDQDDFWFPGKLATLAHILDKNPHVAGVFSDAALIDEDGRALNGGSSAPTQKTLWQIHGFDRMKQEQFANHDQIRLLLRHDIVTGATLMVRASARALWHPIPASWVHDAWIAWMIAVHSRLALISQPLIAYRIHPGQQLGIGEGSRLQKWKQLRKTERARYLALANSFFELLDRVRVSRPLDTELHRSLEHKVASLRRRALLPRGILLRVAKIIADTPNYLRYARGWRSMRKDILLY